MSASTGSSPDRVDSSVKSSCDRRRIVRLRPSWLLFEVELSGDARDGSRQLLATPFRRATQRLRDFGPLAPLEPEVGDAPFVVGQSLTKRAHELPSAEH